MIKQFQRRFILAAMLSLTLVLVVIIGSGAIMNYYAIVSRADETLATLAENNGTFTKDSIEEYLAAKKAFLCGEGDPPPDISYYFVVLMSEDGQPLSVDIKNIMKVDHETAARYADSVWGLCKTKGLLDGYRYLRTDAQDQDGELLIFLDCEQKLLSFQNFLLTSTVTSLAGLTAVWVLLIILAKGIVRPISESYEKQKQFITDAGHELKTPLTIISADTDVLEMRQGSSEWLSDIRIQTERLSKLTHDLIFLAKMEEGHKAARVQEFSISNLAQESVQAFQTLAKVQQKEFSSQIQPGLMLRGDSSQIERLFSVLLDNGLKYSQPGGQISVNLQLRRHSIHLEVFNTTEHIEKDQIPRLFNRFYRIDQSRSSETGGHGIGLSIAKAIVLAHDGEITATSQDGSSLTLIVSLPMQ